MAVSPRLTRALGFDTASEQAAVRPENVNFGVGKTPRLALWAGAYCHNGVFAYGHRPETIFETIRRAARLSSSEYKTRMTAKQSARRPKPQYVESGFRSDGQSVLYDFPGIFEDKARYLTRSYKNFGYRRPKSILHLLTDLQEFRLKIQAHYKNSPYGAVHRKTTLAFIVLDTPALAELKRNEKALQLLHDMFLNGHKERLAILLVVEDATLIPHQFYEVSDLSWFVGDSNQEFCKKLYSTLPIYKKHAGSVHIGLMWNRTQPDTLLSFSFLINEKEDWAIEKKEALKKQDEDWLAYLDALEKERER